MTFAIHGQALFVTMMLLSSLVVASFAAPTLHFNSVAIPTGDDRHKLITTDSMTYTRLDGTTKTISLEYGLLARTGDTIGNYKFLALLDKDGQPVSGDCTTTSSVSNACTADRASPNTMSSTTPDFTSLIPVKTPEGEKLYGFVHAEYPAPASVWHLELSRDDSNGSLTLHKVTPVDMSEYGGVMNPCAGTQSPWCTHLGSEESDPDARHFEAATTTAAFERNIRDQMPYFGVYPGEETMDNIKEHISPYMYGYPTEFVAMADGSNKGMKHYSMGRMASEATLCMPDMKTCFTADDYENGAFFMYIANEPAKLSSGRLFAAKMNQLTSSDGGTFEITWIPLYDESVSDEWVKMHVRTTKFSDIFETADADASNSCPPDFKPVNTDTSYLLECLKLKEGMAKHASVFETRRMAGYVGATTEFRKFEGITFDSHAHKGYVAISTVRSGMEDNHARFDAGLPNDIRLERNDCGCIYELGGAPLVIDGQQLSTFAFNSFNAVLCGNTTGGTVEFPCTPENIAEPDNVAFATGKNTLFIYEDSTSVDKFDCVATQFLWAFDTVTKDLTRIASAPIHAEFTSGNYASGLMGDGITYLTLSAQHPYDDTVGMSIVNEPAATGVQGHFGYISFAFEAIDEPRAPGCPRLADGTMSMSFPVPVAVPEGDARHLLTAVETFTYTTKEGHPVSKPAGYTLLARSGEDFDGLPFLGIVDINGTAISGDCVASAAGSNLCTANRVSPNKMFSTTPDFTSLIPVKTPEGEKLYGFVHAEYPAPASVWHLELSRDMNKNLKLDQATPVDMSEYGGVMNPCAGTQSPWCTHLGSEESDPDARHFEAATTTAAFERDIRDQMPYFGVYPGEETMDNIKEHISPYMYGYPTEFVAMADGSNKGMKHYSMGRMASEATLCMPDMKTCFTSDDYENGAFFMYIANEPAKLSSGRLYAAKMHQMSSYRGGSFNITWIPLYSGSVSNDWVKAQIKTTKFSDIFETASPTGPTCPTGFLPVNTDTSFLLECLKLKTGMEKHASIFETRRMAGYVGATTEFRKFEGITYDHVAHKGYAAISTVRSGMEDNHARFDLGLPNDIALERNDCGCVYELGTGPIEVNGNQITPMGFTTFHAVLCGTKTGGDAASGFECNANSISEPDNVVVAPGKNSLFIYEDSTSLHANNFLWHFDTNSHQLTRVAAAPYNCEFTSGNWAASLFGDGLSYLVLNAQHPYDTAKGFALSSEPAATGFAGYFGYMGPFSFGMEDEPRSIGCPTVADGTMKMSFKEVAVPTAADQHKLIVSPEYSYTTSTGKTDSAPMSWHKLARTGCAGTYPAGDPMEEVCAGTNITGLPFHTITDFQGQPIKGDCAPSGSSSNNCVVDKNSTNNVYGTAPDFMSLLPVKTPNGQQLYSFVHSEYPSSVWHMAVDVDDQNMLSFRTAKPVDMSKYGGVMSPCAGSVSPWCTHLGSEESDPDARHFEAAKVVSQFESSIRGQMPYFGYYPGDYTVEDIKSKISPFMYGYPTEFMAMSDGEYKGVKHFSMGRLASEASMCLADQRTCFSADDYENGVFIMYLADTPKKLSKGRMFAAKMIQKTSMGGGTFDIEWIPMFEGSVSDDQVAAAIMNTKFSDLFDIAEAWNMPNEMGYWCPSGFKPVNTDTSFGLECLKIKPGMEWLASRLETRRYAGYVGATTEFRKFEGMTLNTDDMVGYVAISTVRSGMEDQHARFDKGLPNHIALERNDCGCIYELDIGPFMMNGMEMTKYAFKSFNAITCGSKVGGNKDGFECSPNGISEPDNVAYAVGKNTLFIYEDSTSLHMNNMLWAFDTLERTLTRVATAPMGAEFTSGNWAQGILGDGVSYLTLSAQHPYDQNVGRISDADATGVQAWVGYLGPFTFGNEPQPRQYGCPVIDDGSVFRWGEVVEYQPCAAPKGWKELFAMQKKGEIEFKTGGLGAMMEKGRFTTWVCIRDHLCAVEMGDSHFCFVWDKIQSRFVPWGPNNKLQLTSETCPGPQ